MEAKEAKICRFNRYFQNIISAKIMSDAIYALLEVNSKI